MIRKTFVLATSLLLAAAFSAAPALAGGVAGKSYRVYLVKNGIPNTYEHCISFLGKPSDDAGDFVIKDIETTSGRWRHLGKSGGQTIFKVRFDTTAASYRLQGLRENDGPGESIGVTGFLNYGVLTANVSLAGYEVDSCFFNPVELIEQVWVVR